MEITKIKGEDGEEYYQVQDQDSLQGVYYLAVDREERKLAVASIGPGGDPDEADTLLIGTRLGLEGGEEESGGLAWTYKDDGDLSAKLAALLGPHAAMVQKDLGIQVEAPDLDGERDAVDVAAPSAVAVSDMSFSFDPDVETPGGGEEEGGDPGDGAADGGVTGGLPEPEEGDPEPDDLEIP
jgi:hypothetical protein